MKNIKIMNLSINGTFWRFYLMMAGTIILGFLDQFLIATIWAYILSISFILGINFEKPSTKKAEEKKGRIIPLRKEKESQKVG